MKKIILLSVLISTFSCIEKPEIVPEEIVSFNQLVVPDGFNYAISSSFDLKCDITNFPINGVLLGEVFVEGQLFSKVIITKAETTLSLDIPIHYNEVQMNVHSDDETITKTFTKNEAMVFRATLNSGLSARSVAFGSMKNEDTDGDGVKDDFDWAPEYPRISQGIFIPAFESFNTIGYEDTWPRNGDYDFNDLVISFNLNKYMNKTNELTKVVTNFKLLAIGAGYDNDFCYTLEVPKDKVSITISDPDIEYEVIGYDGITEVRLTRIKSVFGTTGFVNTRESDPIYDPLNFSITAEIDETEKINGNSFAYDFFIRIDGEEGREVHMAGKRPTGKVKRTYFGSADDDTNPSNGKLCLNKNNLPWALMIPEVWDYPMEKENILDAYPDFADFAQNNPNFPWFSDFHGGRVVRSKLYKKK